ncbi:hypothetical protein GYMLUDRAFT_375715 [Collybiopsis luxurians FD-317 M1]|uniref:Uncharacterized protein n=1 Tax=Collybiopsis luxurians FD-317 M1 TaxID=944289 RepID=A0A0D0CB22_9AGAR|nr:hypothetical protein GYMLUDRAFT_375715 [Collybiopsis luxurians FD-317 M1]
MHLVPLTLLQHEGGGIEDKEQFNLLIFVEKPQAERQVDEEDQEEEDQEADTC